MEPRLLFMDLLPPNLQLQLQLQKIYIDRHFLFSSYTVGFYIESPPRISPDPSSVAELPANQGRFDRGQGCARTALPDGRKVTQPLLLGLFLILIARARKLSLIDMRMNEPLQIGQRSSGPQQPESPQDRRSLHRGFLLTLFPIPYLSGSLFDG